ncbi:activator of hsp90 atpase 1 family protein [Apiospora arundinis]
MLPHSQKKFMALNKMPPLSPATSSDTSGANPPSSCTSGGSIPTVPARSEYWRSGPQQAAGSDLQDRPRFSLGGPAGRNGPSRGHIIDGCWIGSSNQLTGNLKVDMPTTAMPSALSSPSSPSSAISRVVEMSLVAGRRKSGSSIPLELDSLPNEVLMHVLSYLEVCDLLATSRTNRHLRALSLHPLLHNLRLRRARASLPPLLFSPSRPTLRDLIAKHIFLTHTTQISRRLARNLVAIRLSRRLPLRPSAETLVQRGVLPGECVPRRQEGAGVVVVAPGLVAKKRAVERERLKDGLRRWVGGVWTGEVRERAEGVRRWEEKAGVGRVWRLKRFWERVGGKEGSEGTPVAT